MTTKPGLGPMRLVLAYALAALGGGCFYHWQLPLPWMMGALLMTAVLALTGVVRRSLPLRVRPFGQAIVATGVGVYFTSDALSAALNWLPLLVTMALATLCLSLLIAYLLTRLLGGNMSRMALAIFPIAPVEAAVLAESLGVAPAPVVMSQSFRIAAIVLTIPLVLYAADGFTRPSLEAAPLLSGFDDFRFLILPFIAYFGIWVFKRLKWANPFMLGPLAIVAGLSAAGLDLPHYPPLILAAGQVILGSWLGSVFQFENIRRAGTEAMLANLGVMILLVLVAGVAVALAKLTGLNWRVLLLAIAPGGVPEMALTAKYMGLSVVLVTASQLVRMFLLMPLAGPVIRWSRRFDRN